MVYLSELRGSIRPHTSFVRPPEWLPLPALTNGVQMLKAVFPGNNFFVIRVVCTGDFTIDWGDGNIISYASNTQVNYNYDYSTVSANTEFRGYRQVIISVTGTNITAVTLNLKHASTAANIPNESGILDLQLEIPTLTTLAIGATNFTVQSHRMMEQAYIGANSITNGTDLFRVLTSLIRVTFFIPSNSLPFTRIFLDCISLTEINFIGDTTNARVTSLQESFNNCQSLVKAPPLNTASVTNWEAAFQNCHSLEYVPLYNRTQGNSMLNIFNSCFRLRHIPLLDTAGVTNFQGAFSTCVNLTDAPPFNTASCINFSSMFSGCRSLVSVPEYNTASGTNFSSMFNGCSALRSLPLLNTASGTTFNAMLQGCTELRDVPQFNTASGTNFTSMFNGCTSLKVVPLLNTTSGTNFSNMFFNCSSIATIPPLNTTNATNIASMFSGCRALKNIPNLNLAAVSSAANVSNLFANCNSLSVGVTTGLRFAISYINCQLSRTELVAIFNGLGTASGSQTITITGNPGAAGLTAEERAIATGKGWTITG